MARLLVAMLYPGGDLYLSALAPPTGREGNRALAEGAAPFTRGFERGRMNIQLFILVSWFAVGAALAVFGSWYMKTHEKEMVEKEPEYQICGCIPPPIKWSVVVLLVLLGPLVLLWAVYEAIQESRKGKDENDAPGATTVAASAPEMDPRVGCMVLYGLIGAALTAWIWANGHTAKPLSTFLEKQARTMALWLFAFVLPGLLVNWRKPFRSLQFPLLLLPLYLVGEVVPSLAAMTGEWEGGWALGSAGACAGGRRGRRWAGCSTHGSWRSLRESIRVRVRGRSCCRSCLPCFSPSTAPTTGPACG